MTITVVKGGKGSGNFGHTGRPGEVGGSSTRPGLKKYDVEQIPRKKIKITKPKYEFDLEDADIYPELQGTSEDPLKPDVRGIGDEVEWEEYNEVGPVRVYHGTSSKYAIKGILNEGLKPGRPWMGRPPSVYFTVNKGEAEHWAQRESEYNNARYDPSSKEIPDYYMVEFAIPDEMDAHIIPDGIANRDFGWESAFRFEGTIMPRQISRIIKISTTKEKKPDKYSPSGFVWNYVTHEEDYTRYEAEQIFKAIRYGYTLIVIKPEDIVTKGGPTSGNFDHAGRPGKVGGSRTATVVDVNSLKAKRSRAKKQYNEFAEKYKGEKVEHGRLLDEYALPRLKDFTGTTQGINIPENKMEMIHHRDGYFIHNHPRYVDENGQEKGGAGFSIEDIAFADKWELDEIVAIGERPDGKRVKYTLTKDPSQAEEGWQDEEGWFGTFSWQHAGDILMNYAREARDKAFQIKDEKGNYEANAYLLSYIAKHFAKDYGHKYTEEVID